MSDYLIVGKSVIKEIIQLNEPFVTPNEDQDNKSYKGDMIRLFDGQAANVAYNLGLLSQKPQLLTKIGADLKEEFSSHLKKYNIDFVSIPDDKGLTARKLLICDSSGNKTIIDSINSFKRFSNEDLEKFVSADFFSSIKISYINNGSLDIDIAFINYIISHNKGIIIIYPLLNDKIDITKWQLTQILRKVVVLITTPENVKKIEKLLNKSINSLFSEFRRLKYIIEVHELSRIIIHGDKKEIKISEGPSLEIKDQSGWKDALTAGLLYGINNKKPIIESTKLGSALASYAVELRGSQTHTPSLEEVIIKIL